MNKDLMNALTIASGGLSGGISSVIAGGNFWAGMRQGLITSGLNHAAHAGEKAMALSQAKKTLIKELETDEDSKSMNEESTNSQVQLSSNGCPDCPANPTEGQQHKSSDGKTYSYQSAGGWWEIPSNTVGSIEPTRPTRWDLVKCFGLLWSNSNYVTKYLGAISSLGKTIGPGHFSLNQYILMSPINVINDFKTSSFCSTVKNWWNWYYE